jgi:hypothetical protein
MPSKKSETFYCAVSYEHVDEDTLADTMDELSEEHFDGSHVDGSQVWIVVLDAANKAAAEKRIQDAVWKVNGGAYCSVCFLSEEQFDEYC